LAPLTSEAGVAAYAEASNDYQTITAVSDIYGGASIASKPIPSYMAQLSWALFYRFGFRLKYKVQNAVYDQPRDKPLKNKANTLRGETAELVYQMSPHLQSYLHFQRQDRLLLSMKNPLYLEFTETSSNELGVGFNWDSENKPGFKYGYGGFLSYVNFEKSKDEEISLDQGLELGLNVKFGFLSSGGWAYWARGQYTMGEFAGETYKFSIQDLSVGVGISKYFGM
jgi:hypothetical protein